MVISDSGVNSFPIILYYEPHKSLACRYLFLINMVYPQRTSFLVYEYEVHIMKSYIIVHEIKLCHACIAVFD